MPFPRLGCFQLRCWVLPFLLFPRTTGINLPTVKLKDNQTNYAFEEGDTVEVNFYLSFDVGDTQLDIIIQHEGGDHFERKCLLKLSPPKQCKSEYPLCRCPDANERNYSLKKIFTVQDKGRWKFVVWVGKDKSPTTIIFLTVKDENTPVIVTYVVICLVVTGLVTGLVFLVKRYPRRLQIARQMLHRVILHRFRRTETSTDVNNFNNPESSASSPRRCDTSPPTVPASTFYALPNKRALGRGGNPGDASHGCAPNPGASTPSSRGSYHHYETVYSSGRVRLAERFFALVASRSRPLDLQSNADGHESLEESYYGTYLTPFSLHSSPTTTS